MLSEDIPPEDHHMTKHIVRMEMNRIAYAINEGKSITELHELLKEAKEEIGKLEEPELAEALQDIWSLVDHNYPICQNTHWEVLASIGNKFRFIDERTLY